MWCTEGFEKAVQLLHLSVHVPEDLDWQPYLRCPRPTRAKVPYSSTARSTPSSNRSSKSPGIGKARCWERRRRAERK